VGDRAHEAVSRRPPIPLDTSVARTRMYTYAANVWDLSIVQGPFSVAPSVPNWAGLNERTLTQYDKAGLCTRAVV
jgi:hypothetical protein